MPRIQPVSRANACPEVGKTLDAIKARAWMVPNLYGTMAHSPAVLNAYMAYGEALSNGQLTAQQRAVVALAVGQANRSQYCISAQTLIGMGTGLSEEVMFQARQGHSEDALMQGLAQLAQKIVAHRGALNDEDLAQARDAGISDAQLIEVIGHVAYSTLTSYVNHIAKTNIDFPVVEL